jgi:hypothetical protein
VHSNNYTGSNYTCLLQFELPLEFTKSPKELLFAVIMQQEDALPNGDVDCNVAIPLTIDGTLYQPIGGLPHGAATGYLLIPLKMDAY